MKNLFFYIIALLNCIIPIFCIILRIMRHNKTNIVFIKQFFYFITIGGFVQSFLMIAFCYNNEELEYLILLAVISVLNIVCCIEWFNKIIIFDNDHFTVKNILGFKHTYNYSDIIGFNIKRRRYKYHTETITRFYLKNKKFSVMTTSYNYTPFFNKVAKEYKK